MDNEAIRVTIMNDSRVVDCEALCGIDWSSREVLDLARQRINKGFSSEIGLEYLDLAEAEAGDPALEWQGVIKDKNLSLPLLLLNGQLRISGKFDIRHLLDTIEVEMEIGE